jgi:broad specificity phosphatase PhoE
MNIYLVRHGEMDYGSPADLDIERLNSFMTGEAEGPLTEKGRKQAEALARYFSGKRITHIYRSDYIRTRQTAAPISTKLRKKPKVVKELGEVNIGTIDPVKWPVFARGFSAVRSLFGATPGPIGRFASLPFKIFVIRFYFFSWIAGWSEQAEGGPAEVIARVKGAFDRIVERHSDADNIVVVTHGYFIFILSLILTRQNPRNAVKLLKPLYVPDASVTKVTVQGKDRPRIKFLASARHLTGLKVTAGRK